MLVYRIFRHPLYIMIWFELHFFLCSIRLKVYDFLFMYTNLSPLLILHKTVQCIKNRTPNHQKKYITCLDTHKKVPYHFDDPPHIYCYNRQIITLYITRKCFQCICRTHKFVVVFYILFISLFLHTKVKLKLLPAFILY